MEYISMMAKQYDVIIRWIEEFRDFQPTNKFDRLVRITGTIGNQISFQSMQSILTESIMIFRSFEVASTVLVSISSVWPPSFSPLIVSVTESDRIVVES
mmetsp:Transcript_264/g.649  ORF Transcript_264/g.649 Transcript_264/m.649 type:complete len:99 (-) Transcript_264:992-1288(-)